MPPLPSAAGVAKIIVKQTLGGVNVYNILHAREPGGLFWTSSQLSTLASAVRSAWVTNVIPLQGSKLTLTDVVCQDLGSNSGAEATTSGTNVGAQASTLPSNVAVCWSWKISRRYRGGHPRTYIAAIPYAHETEPNSLTSTARTSHLAAAAAIRSAINAVTVNGGTATMCAVHYYQNKALLGTPLISDITGVSVDDRLDSQRRRLGRDRT